MRFFMVSVALILASCSTPCADAVSVPTTRAFTCEDGSNLTVTFYPPPSHARVVQQGYAPIDLPTEITGSGYRYAQGGAELRGSFGQQARWTRPGAGLTLCDEAHQP